mmetsp:Transcript_7467/g.11062  ORF Transcript_7467/g.11062 Transcript_7467/m.11062 type:complete len:786 (+) Transcript_7467:173-2530(+)
MEAFPDLFEGDDDLFDDDFKKELQEKLGTFQDDDLDDYYEEGIIDDVDDELYNKFCQELDDLEQETMQDDVSSMASFDTAMTDGGSVDMNDLPEVYQKLFDGTNEHIKQFQETIQKTVGNMATINFEEKKKQLVELNDEVNALMQENKEENEEEEEEETVVLLKAKQLEHIEQEKEAEEEDDFSVLTTLQDNFGIIVNPPVLKPLTNSQEKERAALRERQLAEAKAKAQKEAQEKAKAIEEERRLKEELKAMKEQQRRAKLELKAQREALKRKRAEEKRKLEEERKREQAIAAKLEEERQAKLAAEKEEEDRQFAIFCMQQEEQRMKDVLLAEKLDRLEAQRQAEEKAEREKQERLKRIAYERMLEERRRKAEEERRRIERIREEKARQARHEAYLKKLEDYANQYCASLVNKLKKRCLANWHAQYKIREKRFRERLEKQRVARQHQVASFKSLVRHLDTLSTAMPLKTQHRMKRSTTSIHDILNNIKKVDHDSTKQKAAMTIQRLYQRHRQSNKEQAVITIQRFMRGYQSRQKNLPWMLDQLRWRHLAATFIQKTWRGHRVRQALEKAKQLDDHLNFELETIDMSDLDVPLLDDFSLDVSIPDDRYYNPTGYYATEPLKARSPNEQQPSETLQGNFGRSGYKSKFMKQESKNIKTPIKKKKKPKVTAPPSPPKNPKESANSWGFTNSQTASAFAKWSKKRRGFKSQKKRRNKLKDPMVRLQRIQGKMPESTKMFRKRQPTQTIEQRVDDDVEVMSVSSSGSSHDPLPQQAIDQHQFRFPSIKRS